MKQSGTTVSAQISLAFGPKPIRRPKKKEDHFLSGDWMILAIVFPLTLIGLVMVYNASSLIAERPPFNDSFFFIKKQLQWFLISLVAFFVTSKINIHRLRDWIMPMAALVFVFLLSVLVFGSEINGARRWLSVGIISFQPSEIAKLFTVIYLAHYIDKKGEQLRNFLEGAVPALIVMGLMAILILLEPDFGATVVILAITLLLLFLGGVPLGQILLVIGATIPFFIYWVMSSPYRFKRIQAFLHPWETAQSSGFQVIQSQVALGSGGLTGSGLTGGKQILFFLPEPHTDFIFSVFGEAFGLIGTTLVILLFAGLLWRGTETALDAETPYSRIIAIGMTLLIILPALLNMGVVTGLLPTKGLPLPFISYGGSSLLINSMAVGFLYNVSRQIHPPRRQERR